MGDRTPFLNARLQGYTSTIFAEMSALALATGSINLGQGFPDVDGPDVIKSAAIRAIEDGHNQYPPGIGIAPLRSAIAGHQRRFYGLDFDPDTEILVTAGATEAIASCLLSLCETGDEVVMFEPFYDSYAACTAMAGAQRRVVPLHAPDWSFDSEALENAITERTRLILVNTPHNPTGKVFTLSELEVIADVARRHDLIVVTDEVYEHLVFESPHVPLALLPDMAERTITISSAAKSYSFTGWKIGWVCARPELLTAIRSAKQFLTYVNGAPFQYAIAEGLNTCDDYLVEATAALREKRDLLASGLDAAGFKVFSSHGTFFLTTDISSLTDEDGYTFCLKLPERCGVVAVPSSVFYDDRDASRQLVRWMFSKRREVLDDAIERLSRLG
ncbi:MAG TPA: pyridoxal phosphate-dependent aminotransferase [Acidimicrobiales bacterium]|jgi:N-succinyldiaminopimelate aminotransferase|nr:pyridoxal phosphate-dependent aminotransferase [Acidimicrobiales bacterium]